MDEKQKTAFHEAGHCFRAWCENFLAVRSVCLCHEDGEWSGKTNMKRSWVSLPGRAAVALSGVLAEAKAVASEDGPVRNVASSAALAASIRSVIQDGLPKEDEDVWPIAVPIVGGEPINANVTRPDLEEIPEAYRTEEHLAETLAATATFLNNPLHWAVIQDIAAELERFAPRCLGNFRIYAVIQDAIREQLEDEDED